MDRWPEQSNWVKDMLEEKWERDVQGDGSLCLSSETMNSLREDMHRKKSQSTRFGSLKLHLYWVAKVKPKGARF